jgi:hypothetical protein
MSILRNIKFNLQDPNNLSRSIILQDFKPSIKRG